ncbi:MAG: hypothetical protein R2827_12295 [Bdellovibrionales bacterium]
MENITTPGEVDAQATPAVSETVVIAEQEVTEITEVSIEMTGVEVEAPFEEINSIDEDLKKLDEIENILDLEEAEYSGNLHWQKQSPFFAYADLV